MFIIQPFDVGIFSELKQAWVSAIHTFMKDNLSLLVTKGTFSRVFKMAWEEIMGDKEKVTQLAVNAFRRSSIYPFDSGAVDYSRLVTNLNPMEQEQERQINNLVMDAIVHEPNQNAYTMSGLGKVDEN